MLEMAVLIAWQGLHFVHLGVCLRGRGSISGFSKWSGCCRARGSGRTTSWQAQHFGDGGADCVAGAAFFASLSGLDVVERAARDARNRGRRSMLEMAVLIAWQGQHFVHLGVCLRSRGSISGFSEWFGCCQARGSGRAKSWQAQHFGDGGADCVAGAAFCALGHVFSWQGQHFWNGLDVVERAARDARNRGRHRTLEMAVLIAGQGQHFV